VSNHGNLYEHGIELATNTSSEVRDLDMLSLFSPRRRSRRSAAIRPVEALESRTLLSAVNVISTPGPKGSVNLSFVGTAESDRLTIFMNNEMKVRVTGSTFKVNGGEEQTDLTFDSLNNVTMSLGAGSDSLWVIDVSIRNLVITDGMTATETNTYIVISASKDMQIKRLDATFNLGVAELTLNAAKSMSLDSVSVRLLNTTSSKILVTPVEGGTGTLEITGQFSVDASPGSQSADVVLIHALSNNPGDPARLRLPGGMRVNLGAGKDTFQVIGAAEISGLYSD
jgi:hypothetical protein